MRALQKIILNWLFLLPLSISLDVFSQHNWTWVFGDSILMHFPGGNNPLIDTTVQTKHILEAGASYSDESGNLLFYVNHDSIFGSDNDPMAGGQLLDCDETFTQGVLIIPGTVKNQFYVFYISYFPSGLTPYYVMYSIVDMDSGKVILPNQYLYGTIYGLTEKLTAVRHANGVDWWVLVHDWSAPGGENFIRFLVNENGIQIPDTQAIGSDYSNSLLSD